MKKFVQIAVIFVLLLSLCACADAPKAAESEPQEVESQSSSALEKSAPAPEDSESYADKAETADLECYPQIGASGDYFVFDNYLYAFQASGLSCYDSQGNSVFKTSLSGERVNDIYEYNDGLYPTENGVLYMYHKSGGVIWLDAIGNDGQTLWTVNLEEWGEVRGAASDNNNGLLILINRHRWDGGGITVLNINKDGKITDLDNMVADDTGYVDRGTNALIYNSETGALYGIFREDDDINNNKRFFFEMNTQENTYTQIELTGDYYYVALDESTNTLYAHSLNELSVFDSKLNLIRTHSYEYCNNVFPLSDGRYMVYHSPAGFSEGHTVDIYDKSGQLLTQVDLGYKVHTIIPFENGFIAQTNYIGMGSVYKYDYSGNLLCEIPLDTDDTSCHIYDYNTVFCNPDV